MNRSYADQIQTLAEESATRVFKDFGFNRQCKLIFYKKRDSQTDFITLNWCEVESGIGIAGYLAVTIPEIERFLGRPSEESKFTFSVPIAHALGREYFRWVAANQSEVDSLMSGVVCSDTFAAHKNFSSLCADLNSVRAIVFSERADQWRRLGIGINTVSCYKAAFLMNDGRTTEAAAELDAALAARKGRPVAVSFVISRMRKAMLK